MQDLGFHEQVERYFEYLVARNGYARSTSTAYQIRFESPRVFVEMVFDANRSYELRLLVGEKGSLDTPFSLDEIMRLRRAPDASSFSLVQATTQEALAVWVAKMAEAFREFGEDFIQGNKGSFKEASEQRSREAKDYARERDLRAARVEADAAWRNKDYAILIKVLKPLRAILTRTEIAKLEFAEKQSGNVVYLSGGDTRRKTSGSDG